MGGRKAGVVHIPIERAMNLLAQRGLPVRSQAEANEGATGQARTKNTQATAKKGEKK